MRVASGYRCRPGPPTRCAIAWWRPGVAEPDGTRPGLRVLVGPVAVRRLGLPRSGWGGGWWRVLRGRWRLGVPDNGPAVVIGRRLPQVCADVAFSAHDPARCSSATGRPL